MRLTTFILMISLLQVSASTFGQRFTMQKKNASLNEVFTEIRKQTGYFVIYADDKIDASVKLDINFKQTDLKDVLSFIGKNQELQYTIDDKNVSFKPKAPSFLDRVVATLAGIDVSGRIVDADGRGLPGASVSVKGKGKAVSTGANGSFYLKGVDENAVLVVSFIGYVPKEIKVAKQLGDVVLELSTSKLDEVQVIAYGTTTQRLSTGNVTTIKADVIEKQPVNNPLLALQGRVPGLFIEQATGFAGTGVKVRIQGQNSIKNGNDPLYVIDGIPFNSQLLPINSVNAGPNSILGGSGNTFSFGNPLSFINPSDIESIDVLKDADATSIYGSRAANGAILITTKKGKSGEIKVDLDIQNGWGNVAKRMPLMNTNQYLDARREALKNDGISTLGPYDFDLNGAWDNTRNTDWQKELLGGTAHYIHLQASLSGGSGSTNFSVGAGYHKEGSVFMGDLSNTKGSMRFNLNSASNNQKLKFALSGFYMADNNLLPRIDLTRNAMTLAPVAPKLFNSDGGMNWEPYSGISSFAANPVGYLFSKFNIKTNNLIGNSTLSYELINGLEVKSDFGYNRLQTSSIDYATSKAANPDYKAYYVAATNFGNNTVNSWSIEPQLSYKRTIARGQLEALIGSTILQTKSDGNYIKASGFSTDQVMEDIKSATTISPISSLNSVYKYNALFGRINFNWDDRYIINLTARRDGSSRFGSENQFHNFGAIGGAWIFSAERFIKDNLRFLSFGKLRASYGTTGSDQIDDYRFLSTYYALNPDVQYQGVGSYRPNSLTNPYLQWEETRKMQIGLDLGFINDRILLNSNYSLNRSSNQLLQFGLPYIAGFNSIAANLPATVQNTGWEFTLLTKNLNTSNFKWTSSINITIPKNKLLAVEDFENSTLRDTYLVGKSVNIIKLYHSLGVDPTTGLFQFENGKGSSTTSPVFGEDANLVMTTDPKYYGGFLNSFEFNGIQVDFLFQFTKQIGQNYKYGLLPAGPFGGGQGNLPASLVERWQKPGDISDMQMLSTGYTTYSSLINALNSDAVWSDASYIRLKNVAVSWQVPNAWRKRMRLNNCRLFLQGQNLLTITNYNGLDPETKSTLSLPPLRMITMGIQVGI